MADALATEAAASPFDADRGPDVRPASQHSRSLVGLRGVPAEELRSLLYATGDMLRRIGDPAQRDALRAQLAGRTVATVFFEASTRTRGSFTVAAQRLGAGVVDLSTGTSTGKGETAIDTALTVEAMGAEAIIVRSGRSGAAHAIDRAVRCPVINGGDGRHEHPTQGLLDMYALAEAVGRAETFDLNGVELVIVGDLANSRVMRSGIAAATTLGARITLCGPRAWAPPALRTLGPNVGLVHDLDEALRGHDDRRLAVMMLRVQHERHGTSARPFAGLGSAAAYRARFGLTGERAASLPRGTVVMHPGPINRHVEIDSVVADGHVPGITSTVRRQVSIGVAVRMAVLVRAVIG
ncbi:MAG: aspartate carbamoyltransferase catalytic subunit [Planctomycetota bacterium]